MKTDIHYLTPTEIIHKYPELTHKHHWKRESIGSFLKCNLLNGYYDSSKKIAMIEENSLLDIIQFLNNRLESQKIKF